MSGGHDHDRRRTVTPEAIRTAGLGRVRPNARFWRSLNHRFLKAPFVIRALVRADELWLNLLAAGIGVAAGLLDTIMVGTTKLLHHYLFAIEGTDLSGAASVPALRALVVPIAGGVLLALVAIVVARFGRTRIIDPIEANALYGGQLSLRDGVVVTLQTMLSNGFGASLGLEAGYTQIGSAVASRIGRAFRVRRADLRTLVGCGAAGAIGAAFNAPLTGAFYAFELIIATYSIATLAPVMIASICAVVTVRVLMPPPSFQVDFAGTLSWIDYGSAAATGIACALFGIGVMRGVALIETLFRRSRIPTWLRPVVGGVVVGALALITPAVLSSGHSALRVGFDAYYTAPFLLMLILLKSLASAVSIGAGFRGGLFFASLFLGAMFGKLIAIGWMIVFGLQVPGVVLGIIGMSGMATAIVGGPLTMSFLALETTSSLPLTIAVLVASVASSLTVRRVFGYSFATWRFHLRGEAIRSAADIGWIRDLTVGSMVRRDVATVRLDMPLEQFQVEFPLGATQRVIAVDENGRYAGIITVAEAHATHDREDTLADLLHYQHNMLVPHMSVRDAVAAFSMSESDALVVVDNMANRNVIGLLTEQHALRRYSEELDRRNRERSEL